MISLCFVFLTLVEFAIVVLVKDRKDWKGEAINSGSGKLKIKASLENDRADVVRKHAGKIGATQGSTITLNGTNDEPRRHKPGFWSTILDEIYELPLTTKIDFSTFLLFNTCYFLVNLIYWPYCIFH